MKTQAEFLSDWKKALQAKINAEEPFHGAWKAKEHEAELISLIKRLKRDLDECRESGGSESRYREIWNEKVRIERRLADLRIVYSW